MLLDREEWRFRAQGTMWAVVLGVLMFWSGWGLGRAHAAQGRELQAINRLKADLDTSLTWIGMLEEWQTCFLSDQPLRGCSNYLDSMVAATDRGAWYRLQRKVEP